MSKKKELTHEDVKKIVSSYMNEEHVALVEKAYHFAEVAHHDQRRKSGEPYIIHPIQVAGILANLHMDPETVCAGYLHDIVEDTGATLDDIKELFGPTIAMIVDGDTKLGKIRYKSNKEQMAATHRKLLLAMSKDIRVMISLRTGFIICAPLSICDLISSAASQMKPLKFMLQLQIAWVSVLLSGN